MPAAPAQVLFGELECSSDLPCESARAFRFFANANVELSRARRHDVLGAKIHGADSKHLRIVRQQAHQRRSARDLNWSLLHELSRTLFRQTRENLIAECN